MEEKFYKSKLQPTFTEQSVNSKKKTPTKMEE